MTQFGQRRVSDPGLPGLFVDLYELTMASVYLDEGMDERASFSLFVRDLPPTRRFLLAAGLDAALTWLERMHFTDEDVAYIETLGHFSPMFLDWLRRFRFRGDVFAVPEGTPVFANEPLLEVEAGIAEAQLVETVLLNQMTVATLIASKGARVVLAAGDQPVIDFGTRRSHGTDAALVAARSLYLAGFAGTSNVQAGQIYGIPVTGTMAHSFVQAHDDELDAFRTFARRFPETTLLVDTFDTLAGVRHVIDLARELGDDFRVHAVRLDSGDLAALALDSRVLLDEAGLHEVQIVVSGGLDEDRIAELRSADAPIDGYAVGTRVNVSQDAPSLETAYKLVEYAGVGRQKLSFDKVTLPHRKQVFRRFESGIAVGDTIGTADEDLPGTSLLALVMQQGERISPGRVSLAEAREFTRGQIGQLPPYLKQIELGTSHYPVSLSSRLRANLDASA